MKILSEEEYEEYSSQLKEAQMSSEDKDQKVEKVNNTIENDLFLIGTTIVEDKLQENVPETIRNLRLSNIKVWMLTGDKMNTAYNIGLSCNLINKEMKTFNICGIEVKKNENLEIINKDERDNVIINFAKEFAKFKGEFDAFEKPQFGILVDEKALLTINEDKEIQDLFLNIAKDAVAVICCRVSPLQKSQVVKMMKNYDPKAITLAIGDGGNDVSMIMEAHIGVGIYGEEGMRAVQSSDYAIGEFQILSSLLFFHGRTNYIRNSECIKYFFYKNFVFTVVQFLFGFYCNFTGQTIIDDWYITTYNLLFTSLPLGARALMDHDLKPDDGSVVYKMLPFMYKENRDNPLFTIGNFLLTLLKGIIHCSINFYFVLYSFKGECIGKEGYLPGLWVISVSLFTNILIIVSADIFIHTKYHTWINFVILGVVTALFYILFIMAVHNMTLFNSVGTMVNTFNSIKIWLIFIFVGGTCALIDFTILAFNYSFNRNIVTLLQLIYNSIGKIEYEDDVPEEVKEKLKIVDQYDDKKNDNEEQEFNKNISLLRGDTNKSKVDHSNVQFIDQDSNLFKADENIDNKGSNSNTERNSEKSERVRFLSKNNKRNKKVSSSDISDSTEKKNKSNSISNSSYSKSESNSKNSKNMKNNNIKDSYSYSNSNSNSKNIKSSDKASYNDTDSDIQKDIPKKTMEYMSRYRIDGISTIKKNNNSGISSNEDTVGENYNEEFSEKMGSELNYFFPKQAISKNRSHNYFNEKYSHNNNK